jgi:hypothetical protein
MTSMSGFQASITVTRVESISDIIKSLQAISCDSCEKKLASYDVYMDGGIANVSFLKRYCSDCIQNVTH